jgi:transcriptional regulator with XRE-family HTH domain
MSGAVGLTASGTFAQGTGVESPAVSFGHRLRARRLEAGLSQSALEGRSGIPKARLSRYENGHVVPSIETLGRLAAALGCSEASLLGDQEALAQEILITLQRRGIVIYSTEQAVTLANAIADVLEAAAPPVPRPEAPDAVATAALMPSAAGGVASSVGAPEPIPPA